MADWARKRQSMMRPAGRSSLREPKMNESKKKSITDLFREGTPIDRALAQGVREALRMHKRMGNPVAAWRDGKVVWIQPEDIIVPEDDGESVAEGGAKSPEIS